MNKDWEIKSFEDCIENVKYTTKIPSKDYKQEGAFPIVSQEEELISGYWDNESDLFSLTKPVVIFGDHTRVLKYVDFDFVLGADGVKILQPKDFLDTKFFMYFLSNANIKHLGYARHYRLLKELNVLVPPLEEQKRIVKILDEKFAQLETIKANAQTNLQNAKDLFQSQLTKAFCNTSWEKKRLDTITKIKSGFAFKGSAFKTTGEYQVLRLGNVKQNYLRIDEKAVFVSGISTSDLSKAKVNIGDLVVTQTGTKGKRDYGFVAIVDRDNLLLNQRLAAITTAECLYNRYLLYYSYTESFKNQFFANEGGTVGQGNIGLTDIKDIEIPLPPLPEQKHIVEELDTLSEKVRQLQEIYTKQISNCDELKQSYLQKAFKGEL